MNKSPHLSITVVVDIAIIVSIIIVIVIIIIIIIIIITTPWNFTILSSTNGVVKLSE